MTELKTNILRLQGIVLAFFVAMLSMGFTYQWEVCAHAEEVPAAYCCASQIEEPQCTCADMSHNTCDISFSKYVQFDFEVITTGFQDLFTDVNFVVASSPCSDRVPKELSSKLREYEYSLPPPKSGRHILCAIQTFLI
tara:strand:+ start:534 stop:947 length:414 start_codon:yes stop_codon:yes gene_type:complete